MAKHAEDAGAKKPARKPAPDKPAATPQAAAPAPAPPRAPGPPVQPGPRRIEAIRYERFGDGPGSVQIDADLASGQATLVFKDGQGKEVAREPYKPDEEK